MKRLKNIIVLLFRINILKTIRFNTTYFPLSVALKYPVLIANNVKIGKLRGGVKIEAPIRTGMIKIGFGHVGIFDKKYSRSILEINGRIEFENRAGFGHGSKICVGPNGILKIGDNFSNTAEATIICFKEITFGQNIITSWNILVMDTDFHPTYNTETEDVHAYEAPIRIGDNVWIGTRAVILKGSTIPYGCIIGASSLVCKQYLESHCLIAGNPAKILKHNISIKR